MIALVALAVILAALAVIAMRTTITVVIRKDPDMATIKARLAALEAGQADINTSLDGIKASLDALAHPDTGAASAADLTALSAKVDAIAADIGTDAPAADAIPVADGTGAPGSIDPIPGTQ